MNCSTPFRGGVEIAPTESPDLKGGTCTAGFRALGSNGQRYVLSAGHCAIKDEAHPNLTDIKSDWKAWDDQQLVANNYWGEKHYLGQVEQISFPAHDWMKVNATGTYWDSGNAPASWPSSVVYWPADRYNRPAVNEEVPMNSEAKSITGQTVCHSGIASGTTCGQVVATNVTYDVGEDGQLGYNLARVKGGCFEGGDSGGPYFAGNTAYGLHIGSEDQYHPCTTYAYYHEITEASAALGVKVAPHLPVVETQNASNVQTDRVTLNGIVNPQGLATAYRFDYGATTAYGSSTAMMGAGSGETSLSVHVDASGLQPGTTYHFRLVATSAFGTAYGADKVVTTVSAATPATIVDSNNGLTSVWRGTDGNLYETVARGGKWTTFSPTFGQLPTGVAVASDPSLALDKSNGVMAVWRGSNNHIYETLVFNGSWTTFEPTWGNLPAGITARGNPAAVVDPTNGLSIEWRGSDGNIYETVAPGGGSWTTFSPTWSNKPSGVTVTSDPAAVVDPTNGLSIEWRGSDGNIYETVAPGGGSWTTFSPTWEGKPAGVTVDGAPAVVVDPVNGLTINWRGSDGQLYQTGAPGGGKWNTFSPTFGRLGGVTASGRPAAAVDSSGNLKTAWRGSDGNLFETYPTSGYWTSVGITAFSLPTGVMIVGEPAMIKDPTNGVVAVARGSDGNLYEALLTNGNWTTFSPTWEGKPVGVAVTGTPALAITPTSGLTMSWRGSDGNLYVTRPVSGKWGTFSPTSGNMPPGITVLGSPSAAYDPANGLTIEWRGSDGNIYETVAPGGKWTTFSPTWSNKPSGVTVASDPAAVLDPVNGISIVWRGSNNHLYATVAPGGGSWTTFEQTWGNLPTGITVTGNPAAIIDPTNGLASGWRGSDGNVYETVSTGGKWTTFSPTWENKPAGVTVASDPSLAITSSGITFLWRGTNANVEETVSINGKWTTFAPTWGAIFGKVALGE